MNTASTSCPSRARAIGFAAFLGLVPTPSQAQFFFSSDELSATVVDGNGKPVAGALVVVKWQLEKGRLHGYDYRTLHEAEVVTDNQGVFRVPAWGSKYAGLFWSLGGSSPKAYVLKIGYKAEVLSNYTSSFGGFTCPGSKTAEMSYTGNPTHSSSKVVASWSGCQIRLSPPDGPPDVYAMQLSGLRMVMCGAGTTNQCGEAVRRFFDEERRRLISLGAKEFQLPW
jgi:hypothetical protein